MRYALARIATALAGAATVLASAPPAPATPPERRASALVLLDRAGRLSGEEIASDYAVRWRTSARVLPTRGDRILFDLGDALGIVRAEAQPIPAWIADKAIRASWQWAGAGNLSRRHRAHLLIEVRSPRGDAVANARRLTRLVSAVIATHPVLAILWSDAGMLLEPTHFLADSDASAEDGIPTGLWLNFLPAALSPHLPVVHTMGLAPLGFRELILFGHRSGPDRTLATLVGVADQVLRGRLVLRSGDTVQTTSQETLRVEEIPAPWDGREVALQLSPGPPSRRR